MEVEIERVNTHRLQIEESKGVSSLSELEPHNSDRNLGLDVQHTEDLENFLRKSKVTTTSKIISSRPKNPIKHSSTIHNDL